MQSLYSITMKLLLLLLVVSTPFLIAAVSYLYLPGMISDVTQEELELQHLIQTDSRQERKVLIPNDLLIQYSKWKCNDMLEHEYISHTASNGKGPNYMVKFFNYDLYYTYDKGDTDNNIESLAANYHSLQDVMNAWWASPAHRDHIFGKLKFYKEQDEIGVGIAKNAVSVFYCVTIARHNVK